MFAKLFGEGDDQIVCILTQTEEGEHCIDITFDPKVEGMGLTSVKPTYGDDDHGRAVAQTEFNKLTEETVKPIIDKMREGIRKDFGTT